jgi:predicted  nucleic acid-binding Zn-ribbon protein
MILASAHHIREIKKKYDFDFFDDVINHDYDDEENHRDRLFKFVKEIKRINENKEFFIEFYKNNKFRFEENLRKIEEKVKDQSDSDFLKRISGII